jgi:uncharacterized membrane protein
MYHQHNAIAVVQRLIRHYQLPISNETIIEKLVTHPEYPSLKSICDSLNEWNIINYPMRLDIDELRETGSPFIAHINDGKEKLAFVPKLNGQSKITYFDSPGKSKIMETDMFFKSYSGISVLIDPDEKAGETGFAEKRQTARLNFALPYLAGLGLLLFIAHYLVSYSGPWHIDFFPAALFITKLIGLGLSILLVLKDLNIKNNLADALCGVSKKTNCNSILNTDASRVFGWLHWSDVGLIYFLTGLCMIFSMPNAGGFGLMAILSFGALGYVLYSVYYQAFVARVWCPLCLGVQAVFVAEALLSFIFISDMAFSWISFLKYACFSVVTALGAILYKAYYQNRNTSRNERLDYLKLKKNPEIFVNLLKKIERKSFDLNNEVFLIGQQDAPITVIAFLSLNCNPCKRAFNQLKGLLGKEALAIYLVFSLHDDNAKPFINQVASLFYAKKPHEAVRLLDTWYNGNNRKHLISQAVSSNSVEHYKAIKETHSGLFALTGITGTPTVFVNGYDLPNEYQIIDIPQFIDVLSKPNVSQ